MCKCIFEAAFQVTIAQLESVNPNVYWLLYSQKIIGSFLRGQNENDQSSLHQSLLSPLEHKRRIYEDNAYETNEPYAWKTFENNCNGGKCISPPPLKT